ncbi:MAG: AAA family ATPase, partial [Candidatus Aminicenantes bacterium]|nr:AAA family ATPase [Candidatus Aminicenantes bacterium]
KKWSKEFNTVDFRTIRDNYEIIDGVYKGELINRLKKEGYRLEHDKNNRLNFEIAGFTREQILHFSRVPQIDKKLEEMGTDRKHANAKQRDTANLMTRAEKVLVELDSWRAQFREKMSAMGIKSPTLIQEIELSPQGLPANIPAADLEKTLSQAAGDFLYAHAAFTKREFINGVLKKAGDVLSPRYVEDYFDGSGLFINLGERTGKTYFSTRKNINLEKSLYRYVAADIKRKKGLIKESKVNRFLKHSCLLEGQKSAVRLMAHCPGRVVAIQGDPGVGKSFLLDEARMLFEKEGFFVRGLAPSNQAALTLRKESGLRASTLHAFFVKLQADAGNWKKGYDAFDLRLTNFKGLKRSTQREVWFVDEASMIDNYTMKRLFEAAQIKRAYVILVGDKNQMPPIESGKPFANMINKNLISFVEVKKILRQKETWYVLDSGELSKRHKSRIKKQARYQNAKVIFSDTLPSGSIKAGQLETLRVKRGVEVKVFKDCSLKDAVSQMVNGDIAAGLETLKDRIYEIRNDEERLQKIAETYAGFSPEERAQTIAVTGGNRDRVKVNDYVRSALKRRGELTGGRFVEVKLHGKSEVREFAPGDRVIFLKKKQVSGFWVIKNDTGIVVKVKTKKRLGLKTSGLYMRDKHFITIISRGRRIVVDSERY